MKNTKLIWATPESDKLIGYCARVSNPANQGNEDVSGLLKYCAKHNHWSIFEMASMCIEINTTRDIGRQLLRHKSFSFQELSQRYSDVNVLPKAPLRECRLQDNKNRQNSIECAEDSLTKWWEAAQKRISTDCEQLYEAALKHGIAKEQARALLPEGLTPSRMYMTGTLRSWITYLQARLDPSTQKEHRLIATEIAEIFNEIAPITYSAFFNQTT